MIVKGNKTTEIPPGGVFWITTNKAFLAHLVEMETAEILKSFVVQAGSSRRYRNRTDKTIHLQGELDKLDIYDIEIKGVGSEKVDPVPFELPEEAFEPETLEQKLQRYLGKVMIEKFGNTDEIETMEDALDFDIDGDGIVGTKYEVAAMPPDDTITDVGREATAEPIPQEPVAEPQAEGSPPAEPEPT